MDQAKPSLARRVLAVVVLVIAAIVLFRIALGFLTAVFWIAVLLVLLVAALWAYSTLKAGRRQGGRAGGRVRGSRSAEPLPLSHEDRVEAEKRRIQQQLSDRRRA